MNTCILISSLDKFTETGEECIEGCFKTNLDKFPIFYSSESIKIPYMKSILTGSGPWSFRMRESLKKIDKKYQHIILLLEDFIPKNVNHDILDLAIEYHTNNAELTKFGYYPDFKLEIQSKLYQNYLIYNQHRQPYRISHQPIAIWNRFFLEQTLQKDFSPAEHEIDINRDLDMGYFGSPKIVCIAKHQPKQFASGLDQGDIIEYHHAIFRNEYIKYIGKYD